MVTTIDVDRFISLLHETNYNESETLFLEDGFRNGFDIGYEGPESRQSSADNLPLTVGSKTILWNKLMKEVKLKRVAGPYKEIPFDNYIQSPIGLVPKAGTSGDTRLIFHLSYDCKKDRLNLVNYFTPKDKCSIKYKDLDYAVKAILNLCNSADFKTRSENESESTEHRKGSWCSKFSNHKRKPTIYSGKSDLKSAFRVLRLSRK